MILIINGITLASARLLEKNPKTTTSILQGITLPKVRLTREVYDDEVYSEFSKEISEGNYLAPHFYKSSKTKLSWIPKLKSSINNLRVTRDANLKNRALKNETKTDLSLSKTELKLVKKPTPNFKDLDYDNFQTKMYTGALRVITSREQGEEDFNIDDYDFDVNHDEFSSRPKASEKQKKADLTPEIKKSISLETKPGTKIQPYKKIESETSNKSKVRKSIEQVKEDYYDEVTTKVKDKRDGSDYHESEDDDRTTPKALVKREDLSLEEIKRRNIFRRSVQEGIILQNITNFPKAKAADNINPENGTEVYDTDLVF